MILFARITNEKGKMADKGGNEYLDIDLYVGQDRIAAFTLREVEGGYGVFDRFDERIAFIQKGKKQSDK
jgi:hypothetical protein